MKPIVVLLIGLSAAVVVGALGWLVLALSPPARGDEPIRAFGTLLAVLFGTVAAIWWHQSAEVSNRPLEAHARGGTDQRDANFLNGGAATLTALALFASVFASSPWGSTSSRLCMISVLLLLAMSGRDIGRAIPISLSQGLGVRETLALLILATATTLFIRDMFG